MNRDWKPLLKTTETRWSSLTNQTVRFDKSDCPVLSGPTALRGAARLRLGVPLLRPSDVWSVKELEPHQSNGLRLRVVDLIDKKKKN
jgi:hypothetical protein